MKKSWIFFIPIILIGINLLSISNAENFNRITIQLSVGNTLYVGGSGPGNYSYIQDAVDNASNGDTVFVFKGTYLENVNVNKSINLIGEDKNITIIDAQGGHYSLQILVSDVYLKNFTITNATELFWPDPWETGALGVLQSINVTIENNVFLNNFIGICIYNSNNCVLKNNSMYGCNIVLWGSTVNSYIHDIDCSNMANEIPIYYYKNCKDFTFSGKAGELFFINCTNCTITNVEISNVTNGIQVCYSTDILIENTEITDIQSTGIHFDHSNDNYVKNNLLLNHKHSDFIFLDHSKYNSFEYNIINGKAVGITLMHNSNNNRFYKNDLNSEKIHSMIIDSSNWNQIISNNINGSFIHKTMKIGSGDVLLSKQSFFNKFDQNYWKYWIGNKYELGKIFPKLILGVASAIEDPQTLPIFFDFDWHPATEPYDI